jgi:hypothetical protein
MNRLLLCLISVFAAFAESPGVGRSSGDSASFTIAATIEDPQAYIVSTSAARYMLRTPRGWILNYSPERREIQLIAEQGSIILVSIQDNRFKAFDPSQAGVWLADLMRQHAGATVADRPQVIALGRQAITFDLEWREAEFGARSGRFARLPLEKGFVEFSLIAAEADFGGGLRVLMHLMLSFKAYGVEEAIQVRVPTRE